MLYDNGFIWEFEKMINWKIYFPYLNMNYILKNFKKYKKINSK